VTKNGKLVEEFRVPVIGVDPMRDPRVSTAYQTVTDGQFVSSRNSIVIGSRVVDDLGGAKVGDSVKIKITDRRGEDQVRRFLITGIATSPGGQGLDSEVIMHIDSLRDMLDRDGETGEILVKLNDPKKASDVKNYFLRTFPNDDFKAETIEESAEAALSGFRSGIAMINMIGYFGLMSSAFAVVTIQMMLVSSKTREVGVMRAIGAKRKDVLIIFIVQGMMIGAIGAGIGTAMGLGYTFYAKETKMTFAGSIPLEVSYDWAKITQTAIMAFSLAVVASIYPSYKATKLQPVEAMRYV
jgi:lipoprotein-releasing system permease protein